RSDVAFLLPHRTPPTGPDTLSLHDALPIFALKAEKLVSMTDIAGLLRDKDDESTLIPEVEVSEIEGYKAAGIIAGGMIPKIGGMADAIYQGVHEAVIIDGRVPHTVLLELFSNRGSGTRFYRRSHRE